mgnify:CR=1 FL=1
MTEAPSRATVLRLARYLRILEKLKNLGLVKVFSNNLGDAVGVSAAAVRKDLATFGIQGNKRGGYSIETLIGRLNELLGKRSDQDVVLVGCGRIGSALLSYREFEKEGLRIVAGFDVDERLHRAGPPPVLPLERLEAFVRDRGIRIAIMAVPETAAQRVFERLRAAGIEGVLNFAPSELKCSTPECEEGCPDGCVVQNVNIGLELENLFYMVNLRPTS